LHLCAYKNKQIIQLLKLKNTNYILWAIIGWALLLLRHGYVFGMGDHAEILPYMEYLNDSSKYSNDFYVANIAAIVPNVRWFFCWIFSPFTTHLAPWFFVFHAVYTLFLLIGTMKVCEKLLIPVPITFLGMMGYLLLFYGHIPGGNEWYLNNFQAENVAFVLGIWSLFWTLENKQWTSIAALALATFFHPLAGIQFALLIGASLLFNQKLNWKAWLFYGFTGGVCFVWILINHQSNFAVQPGSPSFFDVLFVFRQPHHSLPTTYSLLGTLLSLVLLIGGLIITFKKQKLLFYIFGLIGLGCIIYTIGVLQFKSVLIAQTQWFKTVSLVTVLGSALVLNYLLSFLPKLIQLLVKAEKVLIIPALISAILIGLILTIPAANLLDKPMYFGKASTQNPLVEISKQIAQEIPATAVFIQPFDADAFHYHSHHASYVSFKAVVHHQSFMYEWYKRMQQVYGLSIDQKGGFALATQANAHYEKQLKEGTLELDVNYALVKKGAYFYPTVLSNDRYQVLLINPLK
jgi:hypothetical protein